MTKPKIFTGVWRQLLVTSIGAFFVVPATAVSLSETRISAEIGDIEAQYELGIAYTHGNDAPQNYRVGFYWLLKAAVAEHDKAEYEVGELYKEGFGVEKNNRHAFEWFRRSAEQGNTNAMYSLGLLYEEGVGIRQNTDTARDWYKKSCDGGYGQACSKSAR